MELHDIDIVYIPSANIEDEDNFLVLMEELLDDIYGMGEHMKRADTEANDTDFYHLVIKYFHNFIVLIFILTMFMFNDERLLD